MDSKLTKRITHHYFYQQMRVHNSVKIFVRIMSLFLLRILVKFFVPIYFFSKPLHILLWNLQHYFTIITSINRQEYITLSRFLYELLPFFDLEFWLSFLYQFTFFSKTTTDITLELTILFHLPIPPSTDKSS